MVYRLASKLKAQSGGQRGNRADIKYAIGGEPRQYNFTFRSKTQLVNLRNHAQRSNFIQIISSRLQLRGDRERWFEAKPNTHIPIVRYFDLTVINVVV